MGIKEQAAAQLLQKKSKELGRLPIKGDFDEESVILIKAQLGPWPRALEKAGLKQPSAKRKKSHAHPRPSRRQGMNTQEIRVEGDKNDEET